MAAPGTVMLGQRLSVIWGLWVSEEFIESSLYRGHGILFSHSPIQPRDESVFSVVYIFRGRVSSSLLFLDCGKIYIT